MSDPAPRRRRMRYRIDDSHPGGRRVVPIEPVELTPEQHAALVELGRKLAENIRKMTETFAEIVTACTAAVRTIEPVDEPEPILPTTIGSTVLVRGMGGNRIALQLRRDTRGRVGWLHAYGNPWIKPIVRDHLITVLFDAGETEPPEPGDAPT